MTGSDIIDIITGMAQLIVRNLEDEIVRLLKIRAARHNRSAEEEHREILRQVLLEAPAAGLVEHLLGIPAAGEDEDFARSDEFGRELEL